MSPYDHYEQAEFALEQVDLMLEAAASGSSDLNYETLDLRVAQELARAQVHATLACWHPGNGDPT